jgi:two-component system, sensor histidine kinase RegB
VSPASRRDGGTGRPATPDAAVTVSTSAPATVPTAARGRGTRTVGASTAAGPWEFGLGPRTLAIIRSTQIVGQLATVLVVDVALGIDLPLTALLTLVAIGAASTLWATRQLIPPHRLGETQLGSVLLLDAAQIGAMLALTGALANPFALFLLFPAILAATTLGRVWCTVVCAMVVAVASVLALVPAPALWSSQGSRLPGLYIAGVWTALVVGTVLIAVYAWRIAEEGRRMSRALAATQLALEREQRLSHLDGLATAAAHDLGTPLSTIAALAGEMLQDVPSSSRAAEDARLLRDQARRCRDILTRFTREAPARAAAGGSEVPLSLMLERLRADHEGRPIDVQLRTSVAPDVIEPAFPPAGEVRHGLANLLDNAVTYARARVTVSLRVDSHRTSIRIADDGPGFPADILHHMGEPFVSTRGDGATHGLGLFIACTFLTRAAAELSFTNEESGATVTVTWPRSRFEGNG